METPTADIYLYEENNERKTYKKFVKPLSIVDKKRYDALINSNAKLVIVPEKLVINNGFIEGYTCKFVDGPTLEQYASNINIDKLILGIRLLENEYDNLAKDKILVCDVNLMNLIFFNDYIYNIDTDSFKIESNSNELVVRLKNIIALKQACFTILANNVKLPNDIKELIDKDMRKPTTMASQMLANFKSNIEIKYNSKFNNLSEIADKLLKEDKNDNNNSWSYRSR